MSIKQAAESVATTTTPIPVGISGLTFIGVTIKEWVLLGTALLIIFQLIVIAPKAYRAILQGKLNIKEKFFNGKGK